jgi:hypothetical protein
MLKIAISGFEPSDGEYDTIEKTLWGVICNIEQVPYNPAGDEVPVGTAATVITSRHHAADSACTHVIAPKNEKRRSLRMLFALARGVPIVSEEFMYACLCANKWESPLAYRVPFYAHAPLGSPQTLLSNMSIHVAGCKSPGAGIVTTLLSTLGATIADISSANCILFGRH